MEIVQKLWTTESMPRVLIMLQLLLSFEISHASILVFFFVFALSKTSF